jgi:hypothetical protein
MLLALGLLAVLLISGCTQSGGLINDRAAAPEAERDPSELVLKLEDMPTGFSLNESRNMTYGETRYTMNSGDVEWPPLASGWKTGYTVFLTKQEEFVGVINNDFIFPADKISDVMKASKKEAEDLGMSFISVPKIGDESFGYKEVRSVFALQMVRYTIEFRKRDVYEVIVVGGLGGQASADDAVKYAQTLERRISVLP